MKDERLLLLLLFSFRFHPFSTYHRRTRELYVPMIHTSLKYGQELHGDKRYRDECPDQNVSQKVSVGLESLSYFVLCRKRIHIMG